MAKPKLRLTGFARFFLAMLFIVPVAFMGASYFNGQDPLTTIKEAVGIEEKAVRTDVETPAPPPPPMEKAGQEAETVKELQDRLNEMYDENSVLKERIKELEAKIEN